MFDIFYKYVLIKKKGIPSVHLNRKTYTNNEIYNFRLELKK